MIDRQGGAICICCDHCGEVFDGQSGEWNEVWPEAKDAGWKSQKVEEEWQHRCPDCA